MEDSTICWWQHALLNLADEICLKDKGHVIRNVMLT